MKRLLTFAAAAVISTAFVSCGSDPAPEVHNHYYTPAKPKTRVVTTKSASVNSYSRSPENFEAVSPPHSYSN